MDWTQTLTILGVFIGGFFFLMTRMDSNKKELEQKMDLNQKENNTRFNAIENRLTSLEAESKNMSQRITDLKTDMNQRLSNIESCVMPRKVFHFEESHHKEDHDEPKEN